MPLTPGTRLGPYEIVSAIGAGGMGEVYRAKDTKLNRDVALKILPEAFTSDVDRLARFRREAQVLASLNHPNIAAIYGFEDSGATHALVMELVEGEDLSAHIARGAIPLAEARPIATQVTDALEAAHERGIVHRDLKPQNIKVRADGTVKVLDFGLAKAVAPDGATALAADAMNSPTMTARATQMGMIIGTAAYMAPEQARGKVVDRRADIWSFGVVLYEMLTGTRAFPGDDITDVLAAVVRAEPAWTRMPTDLSPALLMFLKRCLQKDPKQRLGDIHDMRLALDGAFDTTVTETTATTRSPAARGRLGWIVASVLGLALLVALIPTALYFRAAPPDQSEVRFQIPVHEMPNALLTSISPDGRWIAYAALTDDGRSALWLQSLGSLTAHVLPGTEGAGVPFWSPDSRALAFISGGKLKTIATSGGVANTIADLVYGRGTWNRDGVILVGNQGGQGNERGILRTSARGGELTAATTVDRAGEETYHDFPYFLPDGKHFLYVAWSQQPQRRTLYVGTLGSAERKRLMPAESMAVYSSGQLLFLRNRNLTAQAFDVDRLELSGEPRVVAEDIPTNLAIGGAAFDVSTNGTLIYRTGPGIEADSRQLVWFDRQGKNLGEVGAPDSYAWVRLSNDGKRVATQLTDASGNADVWAIDVDRGARSRITFDPGIDSFPNWSADGRTIFFGSTRHGKYEIYQASSTGTGGEQLIHAHPDTFTPLRDVSVDGRYLIYGTSKDGTGQRDIWVLPTFGDRKAFPFVQTPFEEYAPAISPDNQWMAYTTNESGGPQVVVQSFPDPSRAKYPVSIKGGSEARWRRDGKELYYVAPDHKLMAVAIRGDRELAVGTPVALFDTTMPFPRSDGAQSQRYFDVTADGQRFLINTPRAQSNPSPINVVLNWAAGLKK